MLSILASCFSNVEEGRARAAVVNLLLEYSQGNNPLKAGSALLFSETISSN